MCEYKKCMFWKREAGISEKCTKDPKINIKRIYPFCEFTYICKFFKEEKKPSEKGDYDFNEKNKETYIRFL